MITRIHNKLCFECDSCAATLETEESDFGSALQKLRDSGWKARRFGNVWTHSCTDCQDDAIPKRANGLV